MKKWRKVVIVGDAGTGKSINALHAAKKISKNIGHAYSLVDLDKKINARHKGVILVDDVDAMGRKWKTILEKASLVKNMRVIATSTKNVIVSGFHTIRIKAPRGKDMKELAAVKGWKMIKGTRNLVDLVKANVYDGGVLDAESTSSLKEVRSILNGKGSKKVDKGVIEQVIRNGYEMDHSPDKIEELTRAAAGAWIFMFSRGKPSALLSTINKTTGAASIMYRKGIIDA
jgi:5S rRNA maturation endonuclease (ribonuclease M5)